MSMIPLLYLLATVENLVRFGYVGVYKSIESSGTAPGAVANFPFAITFTVLFIFSISKPKQNLL